MCGTGGFSCISIDLEILGVWRSPVSDDVGWKLWDGVLAVRIMYGLVYLFGKLGLTSSYQLRSVIALPAH